MHAIRQAIRLFPLPDNVHDVLDGIFVHALGGQVIACPDFVAGKAASVGLGLQTVPGGIVVRRPCEPTGRNETRMSDRDDLEKKKNNANPGPYFMGICGLGEFQMRPQISAEPLLLNPLRFTNVFNAY